MGCIFLTLGAVLPLAAAIRQLRPTSGLKSPVGVTSPTAAMLILRDEDALFRLFKSQCKPGQKLSWEEFQPKCLEQVDKIIDMVDEQYADEEIEEGLTHECRMSKEFPKDHSSSFETDEACARFAKALTEARHQEAETGSKHGYTEFCRSYYTHRTGCTSTTTTTSVAAATTWPEDARLVDAPPEGAPPTVVAPSTTTSAPSTWPNVSVTFIAITILACIAFVVVMYILLRG